jgi:flagellar biosynthetic protein FliR
MPHEALVAWILSCLLLGLRFAPTFAFAPPFSLLQMPGLFRPLFGIGLAICLVAAYPAQTKLADVSLYGIVVAAMRELMLGSMFVLALNLAFGALYLAGRTIDIQAGYGFALLIDPKSQAQTPMVGMLFALAAGAVFFAMDGHLNLLRLFGASLEAIPLGGWHMPGSIAKVTSFAGMIFLVGLGVGATTMLVLFLIDTVIALMSRTVPQMNVMVLGFQVKTVVLFLTLPICFGGAGALFVRIMTLTFENLPRMLW